MASLHGQRLSPPGSKLVLVEWTIPGGSADDPEWMAPRHIHHEDDEAWYVLEGRLRVRVGNDDHDIPAGGAVIGPRGIPHTFCNPDPEPVRYLIVMSDKTSALLDIPHSGKRLDAEQIRDLYATHGCELLD
jgi:mannose-6-phosphate isomerase-like protein (cupin superfamily)